MPTRKYADYKAADPYFFLGRDRNQSELSPVSFVGKWR